MCQIWPVACSWLTPVLHLDRGVGYTDVCICTIEETGHLRSVHFSGNDSSTEKFFKKKKGGKELSTDGRLH